MNERSDSGALAVEPSTSTPDHKDMANAIRALSMDAVEAANSGHPGMPMGMADIATVLYARHLNFDPRDPDWPDRDRFVLSNGHGSMLLFSILYLTGYADMTLDQLKAFRQFDSRTAGHPEYGHAQGIETTTGPLGQGIANSVGMAIAERHLAARFGADIVDHYTYVFCGDGCLMEGISHEAISLAGHLRLNKIILFFDDNSISIDGPTSLSVSDDQPARFRACGWDVQSIDGHDPAAIDAAIVHAKSADKPSLIACRTVIGYGSPKKRGTAGVHGAPLGADEIAATRAELGWPHPPFEVPEGVLAAWRATAGSGADARAAWQARLASLEPSARTEFDSIMSGDLPAGTEGAVADYIATLIAEPKKVATRKASQMALEALTPIVPAMIGGSADLTGSNNTNTAVTLPLNRDDYGGRYVYYGVREHAMAAAMNGMALHGGVIPYGGTFLVFTDYCRPSIRLAALMGLRVVFVMTHDSIGLGEDGPTHQPVEQVAMLRATPNLNVFRPCDVVETAECWLVALQSRTTPSVLALTRQNLPQLRTRASGENLCARGAYVLAEPAGARAATILATGSEVELAMEARSRLQADGIATAVVSMPCLELFEAQDAAYRKSVLGTAPRVAVEALSTFGWTRYVEDDSAVIGMRTFGASAPYEKLYEHFGITADAVVAAVKARV